MLEEEERGSTIVADLLRDGVHPGLDWHASTCHPQTPPRSFPRGFLAKESRKTSSLPADVFNHLLPVHRPIWAYWPGCICPDLLTYE